MTVNQSTKIQCIIDSMQSEQRQQFYVKYNNEKVSMLEIVLFLTTVKLLAPFYKKIKLNPVVKGLLISLLILSIIYIITQVIELILIIIGAPSIFYDINYSFNNLVNISIGILVILYLIFVLKNVRKDYERTNNSIKESILKEMGYGL